MEDTDWNFSELDDKGRIAAWRTGGKLRRNGSFGELGLGSGETTYFFTDSLEIVRLKTQILDLQEEHGWELSRANYWENKAAGMSKLLEKIAADLSEYTPQPERDYED